MEYTHSVGDYYESFEGTPQEIATLVAALNANQETPKVKMSKIKLPDLSQAIKPPKASKRRLFNRLKGGEQ